MSDFPIYESNVASINSIRKEWGLLDWTLVNLSVKERMGLA